MLSCLFRQPFPVRKASWLMWLLLFAVTSPALAQLSGSYTINDGLPATATNFPSFTAAAAALTASGVSGPVSFAVDGGPYTEQLVLPAIAGTSATNRIIFNGRGRTIQFGSNNAAQRAVVTLDGADYVTLDSLVIDATVGGTSAAAYGWGVLVVNNADYATIRNSVIQTSTSATNSNFAGIVSSSVATAATTAGPTASEQLTIAGNTITGGYYSVAVVGSGVVASPTPGVEIRNNILRDFHFYGLFASHLGGAQVVGNDISRPTRTTVGVFYGISLGAGMSGALIAKNRIHRAFLPSNTSTSGVFAMYMSTGNAASPNIVANNILYSLGGNGNVYAFYNASSGNMRYYHNTLNLADSLSTGSGNTYGLYQTSGQGVEFKNNVVNVNRGGASYAVYVSSPAGTLSSSHNDLVGLGSDFQTGYYNGSRYASLADWQTANARAFDTGSVSVDPQFVGGSTHPLTPRASALKGTGTPIPSVTDDIVGVARSLTAPDMGAYEFAPVSYDVAVESIDSPGPVVAPGTHPVAATIRNNGGVPLTSVTLRYILNGGNAVVQVFTVAPALASNTTRQLTFTAPVLAAVGSNTLTVLSSLPNGQPDLNAANDQQTITFTQPTPANDEPCGAVALGTGTTASTTSGATTSAQPGVGTNLPACSPALTPKDVWFRFVAPAGATAVQLATTGSAAGMVRVFTAPDCTNGPFTPVFCQSSGTSNVGVGTFLLTGLTAGQTYYVAVSGYGSSDATGPFTIALQPVLSTRASAVAATFSVYPNPSDTGYLTLRLHQPAAAATAELLNAVGQSVRRQRLTGSQLHTLNTTGLPPGLYTLRLTLGHTIVARQVMLQ